MKKAIIIFAAATLALSSGAATQKGPYNKYGMTLYTQEGKKPTLPQAKKIMELYGVDAYALEDALTVFDRPDIKIFDPDTKSVRTEDFVYKKCPDGRELSISVDFAADRSKPNPVLFCFHGGAWRRGGRGAFSEYTKTLAKSHGITGVRVQYSLIDEKNGVMVRDIIEDCRDAVNYIIAHAKELNVDTESFGFIGSSAGGHLAAATAVQFKQSKLLVGWYGAYDLPLLFSTTYLHLKPESLLRKATDGNDLAYLESVSPQFMVKKPVKMASVLFQGACDTTVPAASATNFARRLKECGAKVADVVMYPYGTHSLGAGIYAEDMNRKSMDYILKYLK